MAIVKDGPVPVDPPERIPGEDVPAMVADGLDGGQAPEEHALPGGEAGDAGGEDKGEDVEAEGLEPVGVDGAVGVGDVEAVVLGVDEAVEGAVGVAEAVGEVDPGVDDGEGEEELRGGREDAGRGSGEEEFGGGEGWGVAASDDSGEREAGAAGCVTELLGVDPDRGQEDGDDAASAAEDGGGVVDPASFVTGHGGAVPVVAEGEADGDLHHVVADDGLEAFPSRDVVSLDFILRRVDPIVATQLVDIKEMEECTGDGINDGRQDDGEDIVADPGEDWFLRGQDARWRRRGVPGGGGVGSHVES
ncbi:MAG: hypothetical protein Q9196_006381 [Gyalolechia fulgens]